VRPGDALRFRATVLDAAASRTKSNRGTVTFRWEVLNQAGDVVLSMTGRQFFLRRRDDCQP
jgi:acyl dehydratase